MFTIQKQIKIDHTISSSGCSLRISAKNDLIISRYRIVVLTLPGFQGLINEHGNLINDKES